MRKKVGIGAISAAVLLSVALIGGSDAGAGSAITEAQTIELHIDVCRRPYFYLLGPADAPDSFIMGQVTLCRSPIFDVDGDRAGTHNASCTVSDATDWVCTSVYRFKDGPYTDAGTIVSMGHFEDGDGDEFAITGGTGAYQGVGGHSVQGDGAGINHTLHLIP